MKKFKDLIILLILIMAIVGGNSLYIMAGDITSTGMSQGDLVTYLTNVKASLFNVCTSKVGLGISTTTTRLKTTATATYSIAGIMYETAAVATMQSITAVTQAVSTAAKYLVSVNSSGAFTVTKGASATPLANAVMPVLPSNSAPVGYFTVVTDSSNTFTLGTDALSSPTVVYYNLHTWPDLSLTGL